MHYLITGGCGFIGSHLAEYLLAAGHSLTVIDDLSTGKREHLPTGAELIVGDITTPGIFAEPLKRADGCFHLAAIASVQKAREEPQRTQDVNLGGTIALFDALAKQMKRIPVVFASSAAVYGDQDNGNIHENLPCAPRSTYGRDKLASEGYAEIAATMHGIPAMSLRFFNVYGPRQDASSPYSGVISLFAATFKKNERVTIYGDGEQTRDFVYVGDIVDGLAAAMQKLESRAFLHGVANLCTGSPISINRLAETMKTLIGSRSVIHHGPPREDEIRFSCGDGTLAETLLHFRARTALSDGLKKTLEAL